MEEPLTFLRAKYANNAHIMQKLETYIANLPALLQEAEEEQTQREIRRADAVQKRSAFINYFLQANPFFYVPQTETYVQLVDHVFTAVSEDDITHLILKNVNVDRTLATWKYKIKIQIFKRIKETGLLDADAESASRVAVRSLWPSVFSTKTAAKYFLTVLGDLLRGKRGTTFFMDASFKPFVHVLGDHLATALTKNITDDFKFKYGAQPYSACRTIPGRAADRPFKFNVLSVAAVAAHLSRACSSDAFLAKCDDAEFAITVHGLKDHTPATLVAAFMGEYAAPNVDGSIRFKDLHFLWRVFLREKSLPNVVSSINLKHILTESNMLDATELCRGFAPKHAPAVLNFKYFWDTYVVPDESVFEVVELAELYNAWCEGRHLHLSADACRDWLAPQLVDGKVRARCSLWDKSADVENAMEAFRHHADYSDSADDQFAFYCTYTKRFSKMLVTREYFDSANLLNR